MFEIIRKYVSIIRILYLFLITFLYEVILLSEISIFFLIEKFVNIDNQLKNIYD